MNDRDIVRTYELTAAYLDGPEIWAVNQVDLTVPRGQFLAIAGPSGAGKSTLLRLLAAREPPSFGRILVDGVDVGTLRGNSLADYRRERVGYLPHYPAMLPGLTVLENVVLPIWPQRRRWPDDPRTRARDLLDAVGLGTRLEQRAGRLSAGERERAGLARALVAAPPLLLLDEPTASLEHGSSGEIVGLLDRLNDREALTIIIATRSPHMASLADRVVHMEEGQLREEGELAPRWRTLGEKRRESGAEAEPEPAFGERPRFPSGIWRQGGRVA